MLLGVSLKIATRVKMRENPLTATLETLRRSFVSATLATIGVTDRIFTRVATTEALAVPQSAFMMDLNLHFRILRVCTLCRSFVPATSATIGVTDRIFTRVATTEALAVPQSAFMMDLSQVAAMLRHATPRSALYLCGVACQIPANPMPEAVLLPQKGHVHVQLKPWQLH